MKEKKEKKIGVHTALDPQTLAKVEAMAEREGRSRHAQLRILIEKAIGRKSK